MPAESMEDIIRLAAAEAREWRHRLHSTPEIAFEEHKTAGFISTVLGQMGCEVHTGIGGTGVVALLGSGPITLGLRCELDALPIKEANEFDYRSKDPGHMHACGHDGHMAMLLGAARVFTQIYQEHPLPGRICLIFQPAEENEGGAPRMIESGILERFPLQAIFAMHNWPQLPPGTFGLRVGPIMAAFDRFEIRIRGKGSHAAQPQNGSDVILAQAAVIQALHAMQSRKNPMDPAVLSVTAVNGGEVFNILPEEVVLRGTIRTFERSTRESLIERTRHILAGSELAWGVSIEWILKSGYPATVNAARETEIAREAALATVEPSRVAYPVTPDTGSDDFSFFLEKVPGAYVWIGNGSERGALHNPHYDFNDEIVETGIAFWVNLSRTFFEGRAV